LPPRVSLGSLRSERFNQSNNLKRHERTQHRTEEHKTEELGVVPPSVAAALPNISLPADEQVMVWSRFGLVPWSSSLWQPAAMKVAALLAFVAAEEMLFSEESGIVWAAEPQLDFFVSFIDLAMLDVQLPHVHVQAL
jgi:hypothetical protein